MICRDITILAAAVACVSCATVVDSGEPSDGQEPSGDGDGVSTGDGDGDSNAAGGTSVVVGSGGTTGASGGASSGGAASTGGGSAAGGSSPAAGGGTQDPTGTVLFSDDFESGTDKWTFGEGWSTTTDGSTVLTQSTLDDELRIAYAGEAWGDVVVEGRMKILEFTGSGGSYYAGLMVRTLDEQNGYILAFQSNTDLKIKSLSGGSDSSLSSSASDFDVQTGVWYTIRLQIVGNLMTAFVDGVPLLTASNSSFPAGMIGVATDRATAVFDDIVVTTP